MTLQRRSLFMLMIPVLCWGMAYPAFKLGTVDLGDNSQGKPGIGWEHGPLAGVLFNLLQSGVALLAWVILYPKVLGQLKKPVVWRGFVLGFLLAVGYIANTYAYSIGTDAWVVAFFNALYVIIIPLLLLVFAGFRPIKSFYFGTMVVIGGIYILTDPFRGGFGLGAGLSLICALTFALQIIYIDKFTREVELAPLMMAKMLGYLITFILAGLAFWPFFGQGLTADKVFTAVQKGNNVIWGFIYAGVFATVVAQFIQLKYQKDLHPSHAAVLFNMTPAVAAVTAALFAGESLILKEGGAIGPYSKLAGAGLILAGILLAELGRVWTSQRASAS